MGTGECFKCWWFSGMLLDQSTWWRDTGTVILLPDSLWERVDDAWEGCGRGVNVGMRNGIEAQD
jgi:hypothetical protein